MDDAVDAPTVPEPIRRRRAVEVFGNRFGTLFNDEVVAPTGAEGRYLRWRWSHSGVVVVPTGPAGYLFVPTYRYPIGDVSLEFPRGGCDADEAPARAAARELREETGYACDASLLRRIGTVHADTGLIETGVHVFTAEVRDAEASTARPEAMESVTDPVWASREEVLTWLQKGSVTCGVTLAALALALAAGSLSDGG
ncbi:NUDIX domain-containing protein [Streptomyces sp. AM8-1-1]|uniref:NUDIX domain-containing protein n=1 Tax=Streptomyces sp. AM8-1-1 TaxID=3075825 RepID=UPI0028C3A492|nr:NUDIX domain-containing protein [Streptomyces sp. AM8-1-1]WNO70404.1 NUDIX domain-containing protein [Streptomyces sp. AM8-1-1]